jgi:two-component system alkaline phosphatase synthesis response regulator PhoP
MKDSKKILVIEDEQIIREGLIACLELEGFQVLSSDNGPNGLETFTKEKPDLVILDIMMPGFDGLEVCKRIRSQGSYTPIIILTAKGSEVDKVVGLEIGADDYLVKPFGMRELFARVKVQLRRASPALNTADIGDINYISFGSAHVDFRAYSATKDGESCELSAKEFDLLKYLVINREVPVSRDELLDKVWGYNSYPTTRTVDNFVARLRKKLEDSPDHPKHLLTVHGVGYKFVG